MTLCSSAPLNPGLVLVMLSSDARSPAFRSSSHASSRASFCAAESVASVTAPPAFQAFVIGLGRCWTVLRRSMGRPNGTSS